jgi:hypothetical protein
MNSVQEPPAPAELLDKREARIKQMFGSIAPVYDLLNHLLSLNIDKIWRKKTTRLVPPEGNGPILDCCTGTGDLALAYHKATNGKTPIVAADFCHPMLVRGVAKTAHKGASEHVRFVEADAQRLPFPDDAFQITTVAWRYSNSRGRAVGSSGGSIAVTSATSCRRSGSLFRVAATAPITICRPVSSNFPMAKFWPNGFAGMV